MTEDIAELVKNAAGDRNLVGRDLDQVFATASLSDLALTAACRTSARFDPSFPGWELYRRIVAGFTCYDGGLREWAHGAAWMLAKARVRRSGRCYVEARGAWINAAAEDALHDVVFGYTPESAHARSLQFEVKRDTWNKVYRPMRAAMAIGFETFRAELHAEYFRVRKMATLDPGCNVGMGGRHLDSRDFPRGIHPSGEDRITGGNGNAITLPHRTDNH